MKKLNLERPETSDIKFEVSRFPDGQQDVKITTPKLSLGSYDEEKYWIANPVQLLSRFNSFKHLELIVAATKALRRLGVVDIHLFLPYLLGARSDRQFGEGRTSYLVDVVAPILNAQGYKSITVLDVHSDVAAACINSLTLNNNIPLVNWSLKQIYGEGNHNDKFVLVSPDAGSLKKMYKVADELQYAGDVVTCSKFRNYEGKISRVDVGKIETNQLGYAKKDFILIDDICDGGRTFLEIAKRIVACMGAMREGKIYLIVTHGIFSAGYTELEQYFEHIYCTNSFAEYNPKEYPRELVKQMNIF